MKWKWDQINCGHCLLKQKGTLIYSQQWTSQELTHEKEFRKPKGWCSNRYIPFHTLGIGVVTSHTSDAKQLQEPGHFNEFRGFTNTRDLVDVVILEVSDQQMNRESRNKIDQEPGLDVILGYWSRLHNNVSPVIVRGYETQHLWHRFDKTQANFEPWYTDFDTKLANWCMQ